MTWLTNARITPGSGSRDYEFVAEFPDLPTTPAPLVLDEPDPAAVGPHRASACHFAEDVMAGE